jgi:acyl-CoA dehydrogenase
MRRDWPRAAVAFEESVAKALRSLGGVDVARAAEADPSRRSPAVLDQVGLLSLDPWGDEEESAAVVLGVRAAGAVVLPWPVTHTLAVPARLRSTVDAVYLAPGTARRLDHADLFHSGLAIDLAAGSVHRVTAGAAHPARLDPFGAPVGLRPAAVDMPFDVAAWHLLLDAFWVTGALAAAAELAVAHAREREQFGRRIGKFGEIRWRIADIALAVDGLAELALHAWWLLRSGDAGPADLLALRVHMLESADVVLANGHQILGAMGLCEEHDLAVIDRHLQPVLHRPAGRIASTDLLARAVARDGFDGIHPVRAWT